MFLSVHSGIAQMAVKQEQMCGRMTAMEEQTSSGILPLWSYSEILFLQSILACWVILQSTVIYWYTSWFVHQYIIWKSKCHWRAEQLKTFQIDNYLLILLIYEQYSFWQYLGRCCIFHKFSFWGLKALRSNRSDTNRQKQISSTSHLSLPSLRFQL